jgi:hypothetical protein
MLELMVESDPWMFVLLKKGDVRRRKARVDKSADCYAYDPGRDIPLPKTMAFRTEGKSGWSPSALPVLHGRTFCRVR